MAVTTMAVRIAGVLLVGSMVVIQGVGFLATPAGAEIECSRWREVFRAMPTRTQRIESGGRIVTVTVKWADTDERWAAGFQCATVEEIRNTVVLFDFGREVLTQFHMQNVAASLDIAFAKADGRIFSILRMDPSPTALYGPLGPFRFALEARAGSFASRGIRAGATRLLVSEGASR